MDKGLYIDELAAGKRFSDCIFVVTSTEVKQDKNGKSFLLLGLTDRTGTSNARLFNCTREQIAKITGTRYVCASGTVSEGKYAGSISLDDCFPVPQPEDEAPFTRSVQADHSDQIKRFKRLMASIVDPHLSSLLRQIFDSNVSVRKRFAYATAAKVMHHAYPGGLLEHSSEVAELCDSVCGVIPGVRRDLVVTAALVHDIGKLDEMEHGVAMGEYTEAGHLIGHVVLGACRVAQAADAIPDFPKAVKMAVMHLVLSHPGALEYEAAKVPACMEAMILAQCDLISARAFQYRSTLALAMPGQVSTHVPGLSRVYLGDLGIPSPGHDVVFRNGTTIKRAEAAPALSFQTVVNLQIRGRVAAGDPEDPSSSEENQTRTVVPPPEGADYLLRVDGDSMTGVRIFEHDLLLIKSQSTAKDGDIVVAEIDGEGETVKTLRYAPVGGVATDGTPYPRLEPANPSYDPIPITSGTHIVGKVVGLIRDI